MPRTTKIKYREKRLYQKNELKIKTCTGDGMGKTVQDQCKISKDMQFKEQRMKIKKAKVRKTKVRKETSITYTFHNKIIMKYNTSTVTYQFKFIVTSFLYMYIIFIMIAI